jgi:hypothetical protein
LPVSPSQVVFFWSFERFSLFEGGWPNNQLFTKIVSEQSKVR